MATDYKIASSLTLLAMTTPCHCEAQSAEAISKKERSYYKGLLRFARNDGGTSLAMTGAWVELIVPDIV